MSRLRSFLSTRCFRNGILASPESSQHSVLLQYSSVRHYPAPPKRFYKHTGVLYCDGQYEITLDQRKLKTPKGSIFRVKSEPLALAVAAEWDAQKEKIHQTSMHLFSLSNTALDNPNHTSKFDLVQHILSFLDNDTILFQSPDNSTPNAQALFEMQVREWNPVIEWFNQRFGVDVQPSRDITGPSIPVETRTSIQRHLLSYSDWAIHGFCFGVETIKSVILTLATVERALTAEKAVLLSRLEEEYQSGYWGRVEWAHDLSQQQLQSRLAAAVLFIHLNSVSAAIQKKES